MDSVRDEPLLISHLVRIAIQQIAMQPLWEGLADRQWTEAELKQLESDLGHLDFLADYKTAVSGEKACNLWVVDYIRKSGLTGWNELVNTDHEPSNPGDVEKFLAGATFELIPSGWFDQNKLSLCRFHDEYILPAVNEEQHRINPTKVRESQAAIEKRRSKPYDILSKLYLSSYGKASARFARGQTAVPPFLASRCHYRPTAQIPPQPRWNVRALFSRLERDGRRGQSGCDTARQPRLRQRRLGVAVPRRTRE
jgi:hypothetical protein